MKQLPKISIITPSFNQGVYIEETILSIYKQDYPFFEHIIFDAVSTDNTGEILKKYAHLICISEKDNGQSHAINKGFKKCTGEIIAWQNSDDFYLPGTFEKVANFFNEHGDCMMLYGDCMIVDQDSKPLYTLFFKDWDFKKFIYGRFCPLQPAVFFRREILDTVGFVNENLNYVMDTDFFARIGERYKIMHVPEILGGFRAHEKGKSTNFKNRLALWREFDAVAFRYVKPTPESLFWIYYYRVRNIVGYLYRRYIEKESFVSRIRFRLLKKNK